MFSVGQLVWHRDGRHHGTVLETDGGRVYIEQDNGSEIDFPENELSAVPPREEPARAEAGRAATAGRQDAPARSLNRTLVAADITPEHGRVLGIVPARTVQAVAALYERRSGGRKFSTLDVAGKLNVIVEITGVPYRVMRDCRDRPGELGLMMGKGLADSQKAGA